MANEIGNTQASAVIPEVWRPIILEARYSFAVSDKMFYTEFPEVKSKGDIVHVAVFPRLSVNAVGSGGSVTNQQLTLTDNSITVGQYFESTVEIEELSGWQSLFGDATTLAKKWAQQFAPRLYEKIDNYIFGLTSSYTNTAQGSASVEMSAALIRTGMQVLDTARIPKEDRSVGLGINAYYQLFSDQMFVNAHQTGLAKGAQIVGIDTVPTVYGIKYFESREIATSGGAYQSILTHKESTALVIQKNPLVKQFAQVKWSIPISGVALFGGAVIRGDHAVVLQSTTS